MATYEQEWDAAVNAMLPPLNNRITHLQTTINEIDTRIAKLEGSANPDVEIVKNQMIAQKNRVISRKTAIETEKTNAEARLYASLTEAQKTVVAQLGAAMPARVLELLAQSPSIDIETYFARGAAGQASLPDPSVITDEDRIRIAETLLQLMMNGQ